MAGTAASTRPSLPAASGGGYRAGPGRCWDPGLGMLDSGEQPDPLRSCCTADLCPVRTDPDTASPTYGPGLARDRPECAGTQRCCAAKVPVSMAETDGSGQSRRLRPRGGTDRPATAAGWGWVAVACLIEGIVLRKAGIRGTILILRWTDPKDASPPCCWYMTQTVADEAHGHTLVAQGSVRIHLDLDAGVHQLASKRWTGELEPAASGEESVY